MDCKSLLHLGCAKVATMIKGKSPENQTDSWRRRRSLKNECASSLLSFLLKLVSLTERREPCQVRHNALLTIQPNLTRQTKGHFRVVFANLRLPCAIRICSQRFVEHGDATRTLLRSPPINLPRV